ncbi:MAG: HEPN domain-containing protein, partial [Spirochaetes bacterium]|nr:HEPN domain-containing protein [Spirochaetota bacterium]
MIKHNLSSSKHSGVRAILNHEFLKKGGISKELITIYNNPFKYRKEIDYEDFYHVDPDTVKQMIDKTFIWAVLDLNQRLPACQAGT